MEEFIEIKERITRTRAGSVKNTKLISKSGELSDTFKDMLWNDYYIDVDELEEVDIEALPVDNLKVSDDGDEMGFLVDWRRQHGVND